MGRLFKVFSTPSPPETHPGSLRWQARHVDIAAGRISYNAADYRSAGRKTSAGYRRLCQQTVEVVQNARGVLVVSTLLLLDLRCEITVLPTARVNFVWSSFERYDSFLRGPGMRNHVFLMISVTRVNGCGIPRASSSTMIIYDLNVDFLFFLSQKENLKGNYSRNLNVEFKR